MSVLFQNNLESNDYKIMSTTYISFTALKPACTNLWCDKTALFENHKRDELRKLD